ncbi:ABC transporter ATP-binding protein/permease [Clostridium tagluense]|uniref:ABC transporter ATP-binding protein n=1 Tax=Clostridium tagluense TaxID=360422 RepID=UPI001CF4E677|nr:ABC transporter ATP-binding protein [Clostridium tagluense]MCB2310384.1 ABC transporter ATP-binding protein/permease [Clostridium tagluense]MCB2314974.1 ABC transporter ATP-binding protein/permease [Clostridium tagluense]MCB2320086.1 ABC transporter ATP-binding protein/permease [Clostridium tagluense]MCB2324717.1 ABC transporter ATP-binding protein/permease [Clostridium tagluense]MCB2329829.1 ABC transporter ATP-binding protein/permease [Clostridium tagluense]
MLIENKKYTVLDIVRLPLNCSPLYGILIAISKILDGIIPSLLILATAKFIDISISVVSSSGDLKKVFPSIFLVVALVGYSWISVRLIKFVEIKLEIKLREDLRLGMVKKRARLSYKYIENSESWDLISRVCKDPESKLSKAYINFLALISMIIKVAGLLFILIAQVWWAALIILAVSVPLFKLSVKSGKATYEADKETSKYKRKYEYLKEVLTGRESVDERSLFRFSNNINKKWWEQYEISRKIILKTEAKWFIRMKAGGIITSFISIFIIIVLIKPVTSGLITIGMFIALVNAVTSLIQMLSWNLSFLVGELTKNIEYLKDLTNFSSLKEEKGATDNPLETPVKFKSLEFKNVRFKYPQTENYILDGMSFVIEHGKHYAFVGSNGAGKTTITKLITGLYDEYEGDILIDGNNIREYSQSYLKALCSVVYQDFAKYYISFKDNLSIGRINGIKNKGNDMLIQDAVSTMSLNDVIESLPHGMDTPLGKIKSKGVDVSGGQWQRIAMARAIISPSPLRILDEPTAALDPISESNIYEKFEEISRGGTTIFISHRLGSTKLSDEIFVLGNGQVVESGNHNELISKNGVYTEMYESQKGWYL